MTHNQRKAMLRSWVKKLNHKAYLKNSDSRCGCKYAVATETKCGYKLWTNFYDLKTLEAVLVELLNCETFIKIKDA